MTQEQQATEERSKQLLLYKTVTKELRSFGGFQYPAYGRVEAPIWIADPSIECGYGLHAVELGKSAALLRFEDTWLECSEIEEPVMSADGDKYRFKACVVRQLEDAEVKELCLKSPEWAYLYALKIEKGPSDDTRTAACGSPKFAYRYALNVDLEAREETREAASANGFSARMYTRDIGVQSSFKYREKRLEGGVYNNEYET